MRLRRPRREAPRQSSRPNAPGMSGFGRRRWSPRIALLLTLVVLIPIISLAVGTGFSAVSSWDIRQASVEARTSVDAPSSLMAARALMIDEAIPTVALADAARRGASADTVGKLTGVDFAGRLTTAQQRVDAAAVLRAYPKLAADMAELQKRRTSFISGRVTSQQVILFYSAIASDIDALWTSQLEQMRRDVTGSDYGSSTLIARINVLPTAYALLVTATGRAVAVNAGMQTTVAGADVRRLIAADGAYRAYQKVLVGHLGPEATAAWAALTTDSNVMAFEKVVSQTIDSMAVGAKSPLAGDYQHQARIFVIGAASLARLQAVATAAAADVRALASRQEATATRSFQVSVVFFSVSLLLAAIALLILIRFVVRPLHRLSRAARRLAGGDFSVPAVPPTGPREVAQTIVAVDELAAALAAVEKFTVTLAEDPTAASLDTPLPGRTGVALQTTLDRLLESVRDAERQRVELRKVAMHDQLTGLLNRRAALEAVQRELDRSQRDAIPVMALFVDLDGLKTINDTYGHQAGDEAIRLTAEALQTSARKLDVIARLGGDEFLVAGRCIGTRDDLQVLAERIHTAVGQQTLTVDGQTVSLRCCIGVALSSPGDDVETLIHEADRALYAAKRHGRNRVSWESAIPAQRGTTHSVDAG